MSPRDGAIEVDGRTPLLVVTGMARESRLAAGPGTIVVASGGNTDRLNARLATRGCGDCHAVLSFGIAGGLNSAVNTGNVILATNIVAGNRRWSADTDLADRLAGRLLDGGVKTLRAGIAGSDAPILNAKAKATLWGESQASAVDMESHVAAEFAAAHGLPFAALRVVCDPHSRDLPALAANALGPDGAISLPNVLAGLVREPAQAVALPRLARESQRAFSMLRRCRDLLGIGRGRPDLIQLFGDIA